MGRFLNTKDMKICGPKPASRQAGDFNRFEVKCYGCATAHILWPFLRGLSLPFVLVALQRSPVSSFARNDGGVLETDN